jgi:hypothetical protein
MMAASTRSWAAEPSSELKLIGTEESPKGDISVEHYSGPDGDQEIWLASKTAPPERALLYRHHRQASVLLSPDEQWLVINDAWGSDILEPHLFKRAAGLAFSEVASAQMNEKAWRFFVTQNHLNEPPDYHHKHVAAILWASNSRAVLMSVNGYYDIRSYLDPWLFVFDLNTLQPTMDFGLMNRGALHVAKDEASVGSEARPNHGSQPTPKEGAAEP